MKKILPIIIGITSGIIISFTGINLYQIQVAHGEIGWFDQVVAFGNFFDWKDVFGPSSKGKDLYMLIYSKHFVVPDKNAMTDVAKKYGLTTMEAKSVVGGSIVPLLNTAYKKSPSMTQEQAMAIMQNVENDYAILNETYQIQQEVDTSIRPNEIFANNDLTDSGFDLIYDLSKIEEVLFVDVVPNTIGKPYVDALGSPYVPPQSEYKVQDYNASGSGIAASGYKVTPGTGAGSGTTETSGDGTGTGTSSEKGKADSVGIGKVGSADVVATMALGDKNVVADVASKDECADKNTVKNALDNYEKEAQAAAKSNDGKNSVGANNGVGGSQDGGGENVGGASSASVAGVEEKNTTQENLSPAPKDPWIDLWCPEVPNTPVGGDTYSGLGTVFGDSGFSSLGDVKNSLLNNSTGVLAGAGVGFSSKTLTAQASVCVTVKLIKKTLSSYYPGNNYPGTGSSAKNCVLSEVKAINDLLKQTLSHSLIPNKVTGNLMASTKVAVNLLFDMKFIIIKSPIPTPANNDLILGKNIFESWKKFVDRYQPLLLSYLKIDSVTKFQLENAPAGATQDKIYNDIQREINTATAEAKRELSNIQASEDATNTSLYAQVLIKELDFMTQTFSNYKDLLDKTNSVCQEWGKKPDILQ